MTIERKCSKTLVLAKGVSSCHLHHRQHFQFSRNFVDNTMSRRQHVHNERMTTKINTRKQVLGKDLLCVRFLLKSRHPANVPNVKMISKYLSTVFVKRRSMFSDDELFPLHRIAGNILTVVHMCCFPWNLIHVKRLLIWKLALCIHTQNIVR